MMSNKSPRIVSAAISAVGFVVLTWDNGFSCELDLSEDLPKEAGNPRIEDAGYSLEFDGTDVDFSSPDLYKRAAWQNGKSPRPEAFRAWRKKVGLTQDELASLFDLSRRTIGYYEDGTLLIPHIVALAMKGYELEQRAA
jgi:DNA-binding XRE family transcriptional regulator